ncbi:hypothetical protein F4814DRAFT_445828 [Daldinia grandis]|nr:hypothetical protein F4814DRAFT_445828 [Daldinia grandis]
MTPSEWEEENTQTFTIDEIRTVVQQAKWKTNVKDSKKTGRTYSISRLGENDATLINKKDGYLGFEYDLEGRHVSQNSET